MVKVRIRYRDGRYWMESWGGGHALHKMAYVEISEFLQHQYDVHMAQDQAFQNTLMHLDNIQYERDHPVPDATNKKDERK